MTDTAPPPGWQAMFIDGRRVMARLSRRTPPGILYISPGVNLNYFMAGSVLEPRDLTLANPEE